MFHALLERFRLPPAREASTKTRTNGMVVTGAKGNANGKLAGAPNPNDHGKAAHTPNDHGKAQAANPAATEGRDSQGRFEKGNKLAPGNPFARQVAEARKAFLESGTPEEIKAIARAMIDKAKKGDVAAARVVLEYTIGKPEQTVAPDRLDQEEFKYFSATKGMYAEAKKLIPSVEPRLVLGIMQAARMGMTKEISDIMVPRLLGEVSGYEMPGQPSPNGPNGAKAPSPNGSNGRVEAPGNGKSPAVGG